MRFPRFAIVVPLFLVACSPQGEEITFDDIASSSVAASESASEAASAVEIDIERPATVTPADGPDDEPPPSKIALDVPFASQAPLGNWDMPYQEACEEASMILVSRFLNGQDITPVEMDREILAMVDWQTKANMPADINVAGMVRTAEEYLGLSSWAFYGQDVTIESIERQLAKGNPVILPLAGRDIGNPYFSGEGPWYHVLVVTGYDSKYFITNDVGTKRGEGYKYRKEVLFDAIHDWTGVKENIRQGRKAMVVVTK